MIFSKLRKWYRMSQERKAYERLRELDIAKRARRAADRARRRAQGEE